MLFAMQFVAKNRDMFLENYYLKNKRAVEQGKDGAAVRVGDPGRPAPQRARPRTW